MASVPIFNTGANTGIYLDNSQVNRSAEKLTSDIIGMEKLKTNKAIQDNEKFLEMMAVDPVALMTQRGIEIQSEQMTQFNDKWAAEMKKHQGNLPQDKWIEMRKDRVALESQQGRLAASQQRALHEMQLYQSNPTKYDGKLFEDNFINFMSSGEYVTGLRKRPAIAPDVINKWILEFRKTANTTAASQSAGEMNKITTTTGTKQGAIDAIMSRLGSDEDADAVVEFWADEFEADSMENKRKYFDFNEDGSVTDEEVELARRYGNAMPLAKNPVIKWALDKYAPKFIGSDEALRNKPSSGGFGMFFGQQLKSPGVKGTTQTYGDRTYNDLYDFDGSLILKNIPTEGGVKLRGQSSGPITSKGNIEGYLKHYDAERDVLIVAATGTDPNIDSGTLLEIPAGNINQAELNNLPIRVDGKMTTVGQIRGNKPAGTAAKKKTFNAVTGKFE